MNILGIVQWTNRDKHGIAIAGVCPLMELQESEWRPINAAEEFPSSGQVFWPNAQIAAEDSLVIFQAEPNPGQKDRFKVARAKPALEILDLREYGTEADVRRALVEGVRVSGPVGTIRVLVWCKPDVLVGPIELNRVATGTVRLAETNLAQLGVYRGAEVRAVVVDRTKRLLRIDKAGPSSHVDWDDDALVLRRAVDAAVRIAKQSGPEVLRTTRQIEEAAHSLAALSGDEVQLDRYRLERAMSLLENAETVTHYAAEIAEGLREHPVIEAALGALEATIRTDIEQSARADLDQRLAGERAALKHTSDAHAHAKLELELCEKALREIESQLARARDEVATTANELEAAMHARVLTVLERPLELLAEVGVLRPFLGGGGSNRAPMGMSTSPSANVGWSHTRGEGINDKAALRRALTSAARARGVDPALMLHVHAAVAAGLMPITVGPAALAALTAYAHAACASRAQVVHVSPAALQPHDLEVHGGGILVAAAAAKQVNGLSLVILEGANRAPLEAVVIPLLQLADVGMSVLSDAAGLRLAASLVTGATTVPVTPQIWNHAVAIYPAPATPSVAASDPTEVGLTSDLLAPGDVPAGVIEALLEEWPDCRDVRPTMDRFGSALARLYDDESRVSDSLLHGLVLPYIASALTTEEQTEATNSAGDSDGSLAKTLHRLRRGLG